MGVETFRGRPIDVELPSSVSGQHVVNLKLVVAAPSKDDGREQETRIRAEMTLPVHLRYPDPGCERREDDCDEYAWVEVSRPCKRKSAGGVLQLCTRAKSEVKPCWGEGALFHSRL